MNILLWIALGALAGWLAGLIMGGERRGWLGNILIGVLGAAVGGACLLLWIYNMAQRRMQK